MLDLPPGKSRVVVFNLHHRDKAMEALEQETVGLAPSGPVVLEGPILKPRASHVVSAESFAEVLLGILLIADTSSPCPASPLLGEESGSLVTVVGSLDLTHRPEADGQVGLRHPHSPR